MFNTVILFAFLCFLTKKYRTIKIIIGDKMKLKDKRNLRLNILSIVLVFVIIGAVLIIKITAEDSYGHNNDFKVSNAKEIDLDEIIEKNSAKSKYKEEIIVEEKELEYITKYQNSDSIYVGQTRVSQEGREGIQAITTKIIYDEDNNIIRKEQVSAVVIKSSIDKIIQIGTKKVPPKKIEEGINNGLSFNIALNKPSGFSLEDFTKALTDSKDTNKVFQNNAKYFYYVEKEYKINGIFVAAVGIHESNWGKSKISLDKKNLFGYGAYDSNPYNGAYSFETYSESIDLISRVFVKYYLNPKGTKIYGGEIANGAYYSGNTLSAVNKRYASDKKWANGVYSHMKYLYNKII